MSNVAKSFARHKGIVAPLGWKHCRWHCALHRVNIGTRLNLQPESVTWIHELLSRIVNGVIVIHASPIVRESGEYPEMDRVELEYGASNTV